MPCERSRRENCISSLIRNRLVSTTVAKDVLNFVFTVLSLEVKQQQDAVASSQRYLNLAKDRYRLGIDSYLNVITAQTTLLGNQRTELNLEVEQVNDSVQLIEALGGGWDGSLTATTVAR